MRIAVVGGGASGLTAAIFAKKTDPSAFVTVFEGNRRVGKKLLSTGNGRCNLTNADISPEHYITHSPEALKTALEGRGFDFVRDMFAGLGVPVTLEEGRAYPRSMRAAAVVDALRFECARLGVETAAETKIGGVEYSAGAFTVGGAGFDRLCLACGGKAAPAQGSDGAGFDMAQSLGHKVYTPYPALVQLRTNGGEKDLKGVRVWAGARAVSKGELLREEVGEVQFTDYGLSGIPIMQLSNRFEGDMEIFLDLFPEEEFGAAVEVLLAMAEHTGDLAMPDFMGGYFSKPLTRRVCRQCGLDPERPVEQYTVRDIKRFVNAAKALRFQVTGTNSWPAAQTTRGGVDLNEVDPISMRSKILGGLFFAGEILDVCGDCGGYNLHWAWISGSRAGEALCLK